MLPSLVVPSGKNTNGNPASIAACIPSRALTAEPPCPRATYTVPDIVVIHPTTGHDSISALATNTHGCRAANTTISRYPRWFEITAPRSGYVPATLTSIPIRRTARAANRCSHSALAARVFGRLTASSVPALANIPASTALRHSDRSTLTSSGPHLASNTFLAEQSILSGVNPSSPIVLEYPPPVHHNRVYRRIVLPILALLRMGTSPRKLAWSIAVGLLIGINPVLGTTTVFCLAAAFVLRLNLVASQLANHIVYPLELILVIPFIHIASRIFHTAPIPFSATQLFHAAREHPIALIRQLWQWEWHALMLWAAIAAIAVPIIALTLTPVFRKLLPRVQHHEYPILHHPHHSA